MEYSLEHIIREPAVKTDSPSLLLMLHGYGSNEQDLFSFANELPDNLLIVSARAQLSIMFGGYAWYDIHFQADDKNFSDMPQAIQARDLIVNFIDELQETYHFDPKKSFLMGFSQGTILSYAVALSFPNKIKNILALSGYINEELIIPPSDSDGYSSLDFFCSHGNIDPIIPVDWARKTSDFLDKKQIKYIYNEYDVGHGVAPQNFVDLQDWITKHL